MSYNFKSFFLLFLIIFPNFIFSQTYLNIGFTAGTYIYLNDQYKDPTSHFDSNKKFNIIYPNYQLGTKFAYNFHPRWEVETGFTFFISGFQFANNYYTGGRQGWNVSLDETIKFTTIEFPIKFNYYPKTSKQRFYFTSGLILSKVIFKKRNLNLKGYYNYVDRFSEERYFYNWNTEIMVGIGKKIPIKNFSVLIEPNIRIRTEESVHFGFKLPILVVGLKMIMQYSLPLKKNT